ncbi:hypothetical protein CDAR_257821 [Caerostris darwini]|uniref:Ribosomal protein S14 n=1 Tax=Caerostris darwini TaxID=1538125 RepID=A0AAV4WUN1_9ARAC|nr:hypothetical protein CDAR_257821 [Caerostris darwini]
MKNARRARKISVSSLREEEEKRKIQEDLWRRRVAHLLVYPSTATDSSLRRRIAGRYLADRISLGDGGKSLHISSNRPKPNPSAGGSFNIHRFPTTILSDSEWWRSKRPPVTTSLRFSAKLFRTQPSPQRTRRHNLSLLPSSTGRSSPPAKPISSAATIQRKRPIQFPESE